MDRKRHLQKEISVQYQGSLKEHGLCRSSRGFSAIKLTFNMWARGGKQHFIRFEEKHIF